MNQEFWEKNAIQWSYAIQSRLLESRKTTNPAIIREILRHSPKSVVDLGCGEGWIASELLPNGISYLGLDFSNALIEIARKTRPGARFAPLDYNQAIGTQENGFDIAVFNFALFDEDLRPAMKKAKSLVKPSGLILVQTLHPCFASAPYGDEWRTEDFKAFPAELAGTLRWYSRTLSSWSKTVAESGLRIEEIIEPRDPSTGTPLSMILALGVKP